MNGKKLGDDDAVARPLVKPLAKLPVEETFAFADHLAAKLHALDTQAHARHMGEFSFKGPDEFPEDAEFEAILSVAETAFEQKTGDDDRHVPRPDDETFSNKAGWSAGGSA